MGCVFITRTAVGTGFVSGDVTVDEKMSFHQSVLFMDDMRADFCVADVAQISVVCQADGSYYMHTVCK